jgi:hypothetical protein
MGMGVIRFRLTRRSAVALLAIGLKRMVSVCSSGSCGNVIAEPSRKRFPIHLTGRHLQYNFFLLIHRRLNFKSVEKQKNFHRYVSGAFVSI